MFAVEFPLLPSNLPANFNIFEFGLQHDLKSYARSSKIHPKVTPEAPKVTRGGPKVTPEAPKVTPETPKVSLQAPRRAVLIQDELS